MVNAQSIITLSYTQIEDKKTDEKVGLFNINYSFLIIAYWVVSIDNKYTLRSQAG